jgi:hypothetical protein
MKDEMLCPFSKPIIGNWCRCPHARLAERCSGKMDCTRPQDYLDSCQALVELLRERSRFVLRLGENDSEMTHAQLMKIRCGGLLGMRRVLGLGSEPPAVREVIDAANWRYGAVEAFPFSEVVADIQAFRHRRR